MPNRALIDHIRAATANKPPESRLFASIIAQAIEDADESAQEYIRSDQFREHCYFAGIDTKHLLTLLRKYWVKVCPTSEEPSQAAGDRAIGRKAGPLQ